MERFHCTVTIITIMNMSQSVQTANTCVSFFLNAGHSLLIISLSLYHFKQLKSWGLTKRSNRKQHSKFNLRCLFNARGGANRGIINQGYFRLQPFILFPSTGRPRVKSNFTVTPVKCS